MILKYFDEKLPEIMAKLRDDDVLMITADHGCDPGFTKTTDHTREYVPVLFYHKGIEPKDLGMLVGFDNIANYVRDWLK